MRIKTTIREFLNENNNSHLVEVIPNKYVYHTSNPVFRDRIKKEGLIPKGKSEAWLSDTNIDNKVIFSVFSRFENVDLAKEKFDCNPYSGKYNVHIGLQPEITVEQYVDTALSACLLYTSDAADE